MPKNLGIKKGSIEHGREFPQTAGTVAVLKRRETWMVQADNLNQNHDDILATAGLPYEGQADGNMSAKSVVAREVEPDALYWEVDAEWDSRVEGGNGSQDDPELLRPRIRWSYETAELPLTVDAHTGLPIENSIGEPLFITSPRAVAVRTYTRYENRDIFSYYDDLISQYGNKINADDFHGWPPYTVLLAGIEVDEEAIRKRLWPRVTYVTKYLKWKAPSTYIPRRTYDSEVLHPVTTTEVIGWRESLLDQSSWHYESTDNKKKVPFQDGHGNTTTGNLNRDGTALPEDAPTGHYLRYFRHEVIPFAPLGI